MQRYKTFKCEPDFAEIKFNFQSVFKKFIFYLLYYKSALQEVVDDKRFIAKYMFYLKSGGHKA